MDFLEPLILGVIQGLTEFLPVSSSGHLEIGKALLWDGVDAEESMMMTVTGRMSQLWGMLGHSKKLVRHY